MTYRGHVKNGQIVLDEPAELPEGSRVSIQPLFARSLMGSGSATAILSVLEPWEGPPGELDRLISEVQQMRDGDMLPSRDELG